MTSLKTKKDNICFKKTVTFHMFNVYFFYTAFWRTRQLSSLYCIKVSLRKQLKKRRQPATSASETKSAIGVSLFLFSPTQSDAQFKLPRTSPVRCALSPRPHLAFNPKRKGTVEGWKLHKRNEEYSLHGHPNLEDHNSRNNSRSDWLKRGKCPLDLRLLVWEERKGVAKLSERWLKEIKFMSNDRFREE